MADIEVDDYIGGVQLEEYLANMDGVQGALKDVAKERAAVAHGVLLTHRDKGDSKIEVEHGDVDWYVDLNDESGDNAAWAIELETKALHAAFPEIGE